MARVQLGKFSYASNSFVDGKRASYLLVYQAPGSNALEVAKGIYAVMDDLKKSFPKDVDYVVPFESVSVVKVSINEVVWTLIEALGLVVLVVFLFLQSWRATLIPVLAIPVSIIGTFAFFVPLGFTINTLTMFGFVLAIGIVVDDAIIVVEAVQHYIDHEKMTAKEATHNAMKDISGPVVAIALILAAVFVPVGFLPGIVGRLYQQFAITIAISVSDLCIHRIVAHSGALLSFSETYGGRRQFERPQWTLLQIQRMVPTNDKLLFIGRQEVYRKSSRRHHSVDLSLRGNGYLVQEQADRIYSNRRRRTC